MIIQLLPRILVPAAVALAFVLLRKYMHGSKSTELPRGVSLEELEDRFSSINWVVYPGMAFVGVTFAWITYKCFVALNQFFAAREGPAYFRLLPSPWIWLFFPIFGALSLSWEITLFIWAMFATPQTADLYIRWTNLKAGFNSTKALRWVALLVALPIGIFTLLALPMHTTLHAEEMRIRQYASSSSLKYSYKDARRLAVVNGLRDRDGKFKPRADIIVEFADGYRWSSAANRDFTSVVDTDLLNFLVAKTRLPVEDAETEGDLHF
jgi:hypothetical protein